MRWMRSTTTLTVLAAALGLGGCVASAQYRFDGGPVGAGETALGHVTGQSESYVLLGIVMPDVASRFDRAHANALEQAPGASRLADVQVTDDVLSVLILSRMVTRVTGIAVQKE